MPPDDPIAELLSRAGDRERIEKLETEAADAWWASLTDEQRQVYVELGATARWHLLSLAGRLQRKS